jgi:hypothetical protein
MKQYMVEDLLTYEVCPEGTYIGKAFAMNGSELTDEELEWLNENDHMGVGKAVQSNVEGFLASVITSEAERPPFSWVGG